MAHKNKTVRVSAQVDADTKKAAQRVLSDMGLDMNTAIGAFLKHVARERRMPFTPDARTPIDRATNLALADVQAGRMKTFNSLEDFRKDLYADHH